MGRALSSIAKPPSVADPRLFINTTIPWSFFVCGLQGSGKSHSTSALLESCLIPTPILGHLQKPLSGLILHYSQYATASAFQPCEAAFLSVPHPDFAAHQRHRVPVTVLVSPSNYYNLKTAYAGIPGVTVKRLLLHPAQLNISAMLALMAVDTGDKIPLYMSQIQQILRDIAEESRVFDYRDFVEKLDQMNFTKSQRGPLEQRMSLLESFLDLEADEDPEPLFSDQEGSMTIIDLSCPFVDESLACVMFDICLGLFLSTPSVGKVVAVDEAHKYITNTPGSRELTNSLLSLIRQQRHFGVRTIISTQEPTIDPRLIELSNVTLMHRFTSPEWFARLKRHIGIGQDHKHGTHLAEQDLFSKIVNLRTGEAYAFAPSAMAAGEDGLEKLGGRLLKVKTRKRVTWDGGRSILSVD
ncbi:hypothetical protein EX30DRAFT_305103 [Ascodesmis nigricans]|uniref:P-loop containing nucleoside triphosphate hydrolase protein n=1 Tax=Ascodesmis nigricans TaxID=341454 RepID=A0A4V3SJ26_9PEZI|nr:hypothetical protein EX30DRAFT_305103 [Ascodesmis nigricans]